MSMSETFTSPSLITRIAIGKAVGLVIGLLGFLLAPAMIPDIDIYFRWGLLLWYASIGAVIGVFGVFTYHPILKLPMPWWVRAPIIGAWFNFVLALFTFDKLGTYMSAILSDGGRTASPFWVVLEGALIGLLIGFLCTRYGGEGRETIPQTPE
ncbi:MAG: hypothetical protein JJ850_14550 [Kordiimonadaceae bacterium]|nr:hypothetical protein [Kordiimonadaceae bacterium]MBO6570065.1 hypothetical protein [Kordiimonadaceae bacterium]MBO6965838.1 hypothetical protein [Kordiimonadaceae bacterium]